ncbi:MAG: hypothetical protein OXU61_08620 [Gammaproteobacteria bacterium]|nr:hypothetical protein [Gammaproteobacteria bacterium]
MSKEDSASFSWPVSARMAATTLCEWESAGSSAIARLNDSRASLRRPMRHSAIARPL